jgi:DNA-binding NarL/FixJ family response regulator
VKTDLSPREWEVARLVADCLKVPDIAERMGVTETQVHRLIDQVVVKWNLDPTRDARAQIVKRLAQHPVAA